MMLIVKIACALLPVVVMLYVDVDLSSAVHIPVIGITAICVALCDALFGQIVSNTRWIPFSGCYTPSEAQKLAKEFRGFHKNLFVEWMVVKICSSIAITVSAIMIIKELPCWLVTYRRFMLIGGYLALGVSIVMAIDFVFTYFHAADVADEARLKDMNNIYKKEHHELYHRDEETVDIQLREFGKAYTSTSEDSKTI